MAVSQQPSMRPSWVGQQPPVMFSATHLGYFEHSVPILIVTCRSHPSKNAAGLGWMSKTIHTIVKSAEGFSNSALDTTHKFW